MKFFIFLVILIINFSCSNSPSGQTKQENKTATTDSLINNPGIMSDSEYVKGARLIAANDCLGCHKINVKAIGPCYDSVAAKYELNEGNIENLSYKIIKGGKGAWGNKTAMTPHPDLQPNDAAAMVKYILSLRKH